MAAPGATEHYVWKKETPDLPINFRDILMSAAKADSTTQTLYQELIWILRNRVRYEDYPEESKKLLNEIDAQANIKLPSGAKSVAVEVVKNLLGQHGVNAPDPIFE